MITVVLGLPGAGKTAFMTYQMMSNPHNNYISNIKTRGIKNNMMLRKDMIYNKSLVLTKKNGTQVFRYDVNKDFWINYKETHKQQLNIILDEVHQILNARSGRKKEVQPILDWLSLIRRVLGSHDHSYGSLYMLTQIERRLDIVPKEMATSFIHLTCNFIISCNNCGWQKYSNNEVAEQYNECPRCCNKTSRHGHFLDSHYFNNYDMFLMWKYRGFKTYFKHVLINDIGMIFRNFESLSWDALID